jgi:beta-mannosidase
MKKHICTLIVYLLLVLPLAAQQNMVIDLQNWQFRKVGDSTSWIKATVPGCVHTDLLHAGIIADPFYGNNEKTVEWVEREDWEYQTFFEVKNKFLKNDFIHIRFEGLDTYADVFLNDSLILQNENMFVEHTIDVKNLLQKGVNKLYIKFYSSVNKAKVLQQQYPVPLPGEERVFVRKAQYQFGWDWGPRLVTAGIWKPVTLFAEDNIRVKESDINFFEDINDIAKIDVKLNFQANNKSDYKIVFKEITTDTDIICNGILCAFPNHRTF